VELKVPKGATRLNIQPALFSVAPGRSKMADLIVTPRLAVTTQLADAVLPAGMSLNWDTTSIVTVNAKRAQVSLDGIWRFIPAAEGSAEPPPVGWAYVKVPGSWQGREGRGQRERWARGSVRRPAGHGRRPAVDLYDGAAGRASRWYQRQVLIPAAWQGRAISLRFDRVCTDAMVWVNGKECGRIAWPWARWTSHLQ